MADASSTRISTPDRDTECTIVELFESYEIVDAYLKEKGAPEHVQAELDAMVEAVRCVIMTPPTSSRTEEAIKTLQKPVQKLADRIEASDKSPDRPRASYAAVAGACQLPRKAPVRARECPERKKQITAAQEAYNTRLVRYQVGAELPVQTRRTFVFDSAPAPAPAPTPAPTVEEERDSQWT